MSVLLEICVDSLQSAHAARAGGADRLEVCGDLMAGGTTPSIGLVQQCVAEVRLPVMMMIRPHAGGFDYGASDLDTMMADIAAARSVGAAGVVFGVLAVDRSVDVGCCAKLMEAASGLETTFHRAFDIVNDPLRAFGAIQQLGFNRLLTSGQQKSAIAGVELIRELVGLNANVDVMAGAGVHAENVVELIQSTGVSELHASASAVVVDGHDSKLVAFTSRRIMTQAKQVAGIKRELMRS